MKIFSPQVLKEIENLTCERQGIDSVKLVERAAAAVSYELISRFLPSKRFVVVAGPGTNGAIALAVAYALLEQGYKRIEVFLMNISDDLSHDCGEMRRKLIPVEGVDFTEVKKGSFSPPYLSKNDVVIDGLFGYEIADSMRGGFPVFAQYISDSGAFVVSIDIPSGLGASWNNAGTLRRDMMHASLTLALQLPKLPFFLEEYAAVVGEWKLLDIELDATAIKEKPTDFRLLEARTIRPLLRPRPLFSGKRDYGSAMLFAGSAGMLGAAVMCARACLKAGVGLVTVHSARVGMPVLQSAVPEAMFEPDKNDYRITDMTLHHTHQAVAAGPGIGTAGATYEALETMISSCKSPLVLDADALNIIAEHPHLLTQLPAETIITPHIGEFDRLFGQQADSEERLRKAIEVSAHYGINIVLKGHFTSVVCPSGRVYFNSTGNTGMATAGAGDVLTGIITAFLAQGYTPKQAANIGVYIHGLAGDMAAEEIGEYGLTATDIANYAGRAIRAVIEKTVR